MRLWRRQQVQSFWALMSVLTLGARQVIERDGIELRYYSVIYDIVDDVKAAMSGLLAPELREEIVGIAEVRDVFNSPKFGQIAGCMVVEGIIYRNKKIRVLRDNVGGLRR